MPSRPRLLAAGLIAAACLLARPARAQYVDESRGPQLTLGPVDLSLRGYFRAPLRFAWRDRGKNLTDNELVYSIHTPWLVDDDYFHSGFGYLRTQEQDYAELFFTAGTKHVQGTVAFMGSLFSDWARPLIDNQLGIAQGFLTFKWDWEGKGWKLKVQAKGGAFWDRFGWLENYDTYIFGRTHQMGAQGRMQLDLGRLSLTGLFGFGAHLEAIDLNEGLTLMTYGTVSASWDHMAGVGFYYLDAGTQDRRQLKQITDADENVTGFDAWVRHPAVGRVYLAASYVGASQVEYLSPAIEVMHSYGGRGLEENFLGTERSDNGTGSLTNFAAEWSWSLRGLMDKYARDQMGWMGEGRDINLKAFCLYTKVGSHQMDTDPTVNKDGKQYFKWGLEPSARLFSWVSVALRYDRVILDMNDDANSFRVLTPKVILHVDWLAQAQIFFQYSHYWYGARVQLRPGQVALETQPDSDVFKMQAQFVF